mmetsp:Transcript_41238/g.92858  ORF Transcript_41238/g.92858 Transcript_41238/m.92858 type:complete len:203 (+) Transcript_41238:1593-2201(+)
MKGTALYQVGPSSASHRNTLSSPPAAGKPGEASTAAPATRLASRFTARPWMWWSGSRLRQQSVDGSSPSVDAMHCAPTHRFSCVSGTILGLEVVPLVCSTSATSPRLAGRAALSPVRGDEQPARGARGLHASSGARRRGEAGCHSSRNRPAPSRLSGFKSNTGTLRAAATFSTSELTCLCVCVCACFFFKFKVFCSKAIMKE